ncbi:MAG: thiamine monophosphate kinase [Betaproteobacteria bacterium SG8_40]|nr:MAG: thiamine monophosphate kinase [Betaproteobacteria bacterium SG8_40]
MSTEFDLIDRFFSRSSPAAKLGVGDDAALVEPSAGHDLAMTMDTLVSGVHFSPNCEPRALGHKALAVNLSDLAAMGARPRWVMLAITLPAIDEAWLEDFAGGFYDLAQRYDVALIGGDTTHGPLSLTVAATGEVAADKALRRDGARAGDEVWVSGHIGSAALALRHRRGELRLKGGDLDICSTRLDRPAPRIELGEALVGVASSAIDVSDGLVADAGHIAQRSGVRIEIRYDAVPVIAGLMHLKADHGVRSAVLAGGDDYELLFTVPAHAAGQLDRVSATLGLALTRIGVVVPGSGVAVLDSSGSVIDVGSGGYDHFE